MLRRPPRSPRFPCTTLFRSDAGGNADAGFRALHGGTGTGGSAEWRVERQRLRWDILDAFAEAAQQAGIPATEDRSEEPSELQSQSNLVCRLLLEKKKKNEEA